MQLSTVVSASSVMIDFSCVMTPGTAAVQLWIRLWVVMPWMVKKRQIYLLVESAGSREFEVFLEYPHSPVEIAVESGH